MKHKIEFFQNPGNHAWFVQIDGLQDLDFGYYYTEAMARSAWDAAHNPRVFGIEITDTYGGESNYSWVHRFNVTARTERGAMRKIGREFGYAWRNVGCDRWDALGACICAFILDEPHNPETVTVKDI